MKIGTEFNVTVRDKLNLATVVKSPFVPNRYHKEPKPESKEH